MNYPDTPRYLPSRHLASFLDGNARLCFYPSCGERHLGDIFRLPYDVFVFSDRGEELFRTVPWLKKTILRNLRGEDPGLEVLRETTHTRVVRFRGKIGFFLFCDNFHALDVIRNAHAKISGLVGICCGCQDGGNVPDDCVTETRFLTKLLPLLADGADYFIDHAQNPSFHDQTREARNWQAYQSFFKSWAGVVGRRHVDFALKDLLTIDGNLDGDSPEEYRTFRDGRLGADFIDRVDTSPLWKLLNFRLNGGAPIIAHYTISVR